MAQAFRLRHRVFLEEQGWDDLAESDDLALDEFDNKNAVHMLYVDEGKVFGYQRLLPTTSPHVLSDVLPELCMGELSRWSPYLGAVAPLHRPGPSMGQAFGKYHRHRTRSGAG